MKINHFLPMMLCFSFLLTTVGCDKAELQKPVVDNQPIVPRGPTIECSDCPVDYCCCAIEWISTPILPSFTFCGVTSPNVSTNTCSDMWGTCTISGYQLTIGLTGLYDLDLFCAAPNSAFSVSSNAIGTARISCQYGQLGAISTDLTFPGKKYVYVDDNCEVSQHCP